MITAGGKILKKIPAVTAAGGISVKYVLIKLTDVPYPIVVKTIKMAK